MLVIEYVIGLFYKYIINAIIIIRRRLLNIFYLHVF